MLALFASHTLPRNSERTASGKLKVVDIAVSLPILGSILPAGAIVPTPVTVVSTLRNIKLGQCGYPALVNCSPRPALTYLFVSHCAVQRISQAAGPVRAQVQNATTLIAQELQ